MSDVIYVVISHDGYEEQFLRYFTRDKDDGLRMLQKIYDEAIEERRAWNDMGEKRYPMYDHHELREYPMNHELSIFDHGETIKHIPPPEGPV